jgi:hypothetical protein
MFSRRDEGEIKTTDIPAGIDSARPEVQEERRPVGEGAEFRGRDSAPPEK